jgi:UDP-N-acetylglucosamine 2-epimerase (hydrolysing)
VNEVVFLTGTRADYGKLKSLIKILHLDSNYNVSIIATGMHLLPKYGSTVNQIIEDNLGNVVILPNYTQEQQMEITLAKTIENISNFISETKVDLLVVHGDRVEALAGAIVGAIRNVPVAHIEGGEVSGTVDGVIRHSVTKLAHLHFVSNSISRQRLIQLGEQPNSIFEIGSPDIDVMFSNFLPSIAEVRKRYEINFSEYAIVIFHPVTTEDDNVQEYAENLCQALIQSKENYVVIKPNNDRGSEIIQRSLNQKLVGPNFRHLASMRFEYFLTLIKHSRFMIGNSSAGIREAPYYGVPAINIGSRQRNRSKSKMVINSDSDTESIFEAIQRINGIDTKPEFEFGKGDSSIKFKSVLDNILKWPISIDKIFNDVL